MRRLRTAAVVAVLAAAAPAPAGAEGSVHAQGTLHLRSTRTRNAPDADVLFDRGLSTFDTGRYLTPEGSERWGSLFASLRLDGVHLGGDLRWAISADTGELRRKAYPELVDVCFASPVLAPTGLAVVGSGRCVGATGVVTLEETALGPTQAVSNGRPLDEELRKTLFLREAWAAWSFGRAGFATIRAGRRRTVVADGFVHDDYATGLELRLDLGALGPRWDLAVGLFQPTRDFPRTVEGISPVAYARADFLPSLFEHAGVFVAALRDRTGSVGELVRASVVEWGVGNLERAFGTPAEPAAARGLASALAAPLESDASIGWVGTSGSLAPLRGHRVGWTLALQGGTLHRLSSSGPGGTQVWDEDVPLQGRLASLRWESDLGSKVSAGAFFLFISGGLPPVRGPRGAPLPGREDSYDAFLGISPFVTTTNLFFGGGLSETFASRQATAPGVNGRGVVAPGLTLAVDPTPKVSLLGKAAYLRSDVTGPYGGDVYGTEADFAVTWAPRDWLLVGAELDVLWPGDFYAGRHTVYKSVLAVDLVTP